MTILSTLSASVLGPLETLLSPLGAHRLSARVSSGQGPTLGEPELVTSQTVWEFLEAGGPVMIPLALCSVVVTALAMERYLRLRRSLVCPKHTEEEVALVAQGRFEEARKRVEQNRSPAGRILLAGLRRRGFALDEVEHAMEDQGRKEAERMQAPVRTLSILGNITPLMGLLGTVLGIAEAFHRVVKTGMGKPEHLAAGIDEALTTTIAGLVIAIPAIIIAAHLNGRVRRLMLHVDDKLAPVVEQLARRRREESDAA